MSRHTVILPSHMMRDFQCEFNPLYQPMRFISAPDFSNGYRPSLVHEASMTMTLRIEAYVQDPREFANASRFLVYNLRTGGTSDPVDAQQLDVLIELLQASKQEPIIREKLEDLLKLHTLLFR